MFNLLPESLIKSIKSEYRMRIVVMYLLLFLIVQLSFFVMLVPTWFSSFYKEKGVVVSTYKANESFSDIKPEEISNTIRYLNRKISVIDSTLQYPKIVSLLDLILSKKTESIKINSINYSFSLDNSGVMNIRGISSSRESLALFVKDLESIKDFSAVELPISNLAKNKDISFSVKLNINSK